ncbi:uncharacterized protein LOC120015589 [Tripterygium wilfordii]|uniref:uncharacterized protein LOC120015589 n=1 Tax=Tripterygium wilfordii TaxID=458696 RepID=UPI0018F7FEDA|nr:uncharacterized protein LOC120015589 [Tripterygium wilfordii]
MFFTRSDIGALNMSDYFKNFTVKTKYGAVAATATPIVIFAGIYVAWAYIRQGWKRRAMDRRVFSRSMSFGAIRGGNLALKRLLGYHKARADPKTLEDAEKELRNLISQDQPDFKKLQKTIAKLEMSGKEDIAISVLEKALNKAIKEKQPQEAYEIEMMLVEMNIYKGDFSKAPDYKCLKEKNMSDGRRPLYKAILYVMRKDKDEDEDLEEAKKYWKEFKELRTNYYWPPGMQEDKLYKVITDFEEFKEVVEVLKKDIKEVHKQGTNKV